MSVDPRKECVVCAWRETCQKKFMTDRTEAHCPDFTRDEKLPATEEAAPVKDSHKKIVDPFAD
ncbi:hypothetical protein FDZ71_02025 [bacterium]|nr:MAG: hypothetical protein FDZ71_02025 [bacterium]